MFMTVLLWTLDTGDFPAAYPMAWNTPETRLGNAGSAADRLRGG